MGAAELREKLKTAKARRRVDEKIIVDVNEQMNDKEQGRYQSRST
jgi:hypothetical protein